MRTLVLFVKWSRYQETYDLFVLTSWEDFRRIIIQRAIQAIHKNHEAQPFLYKPRVRIKKQW